MSKSLVIVESPAKAKTINKYLGSGYLVRSCIGHIRDLPKSGSGRRTKESLPEVPPEGEKYSRIIRSMGVNPYRGWEAKYEILPGKDKVVQELQNLAKTAKDIYLATDLDREGEAIAWNLQEVLGKEKDYKRVIFSEITQEAIKAAFDKPRKLDINRVQAQQTRRYLDRVVGYMLSPLLWKKVARGLSAGRVQSVAVKLVTEKEREIRRFQPQEFWTMDIDVESKEKHKFTMEVAKHKSKTYKPTSKEESDLALEEIKKNKILVQEVQESMQKSSPPPPFITSTLQQASSTRLGFTVKRTMIAAQKLYEAGFITYIRTDSVNISSSSLEQCRAFIAKSFPKQYLPDSPRYYKGRAKKSQDAHEAIRPSNVALNADKLGANPSIGPSEQKLYQLIYTRFVASQMTDAIFQKTKITAHAGDYELQVAGRTLEFDGFSKISPIINTDAVLLPADLQRGEELAGKKFRPEQHFTKPTARFNEASLVKELEKLGIGRPSTYSPIISTIQDRGYVRLINKKFHAEKIAEIVTDRLDDNFPNLLAYDFTASMEGNLDSIASDETSWTKVLDSFYKDFIGKLEKAESTTGMKDNFAVPTEMDCTNCGRKMVIRNSATGIFLGCPGYDDKDNPCKKTINLSSVTEDVSDHEEERPPTEKMECKICGSFMNDFVVDAEQSMHICDNNPDCHGNVIELGDFSAKAPKLEEIDCDKCNKVMEMKSGRFGKYFECRDVECGNKRRVMPNGQIAPPRMKPLETDIPCLKYPGSNYVIRESALGLFMAAPGFPKQRETRSPFVRELLPYKKLLDKKFHFLMTAPQEDDGILFQVRYSRKNQENYVATFNDKNKPIRQAFYKGKQWELEEAKKTRPATKAKAKPKTKAKATKATKTKKAT
ncbi:MAG: type I DNA topoisomerase [Gammaproteobacteria bacterium]|nr:type I DNA topoisomerase [Gammaproteobacteria bacterium]